MFKKVAIGIGVLLLLFIVALILVPNQTPTQQNNQNQQQPAAATPATTTPTTVTNPTPLSIMTASVKHYQDLLNAGETALGDKPYTSANEALAAFSDPNSAASKFSDYRKNLDPQNDMSYLDAFKQADNFFTANNEPAAMASWRDSMTEMTQDLYQWVEVATKWQDGETSTANLSVAQNKVTNDLNQAQSIAETIK